MDNRNNRWLAGLSLFALFGVFALAGGRAQTSSNVIVTNTATQQVPVLPAARPAPGSAYIVSVANAPDVKVVSSAAAPVSTKEVNAVDAYTLVQHGQFTISAGNGYQSVSFMPSSSLASIIDGINVNTYSVNTGESGDFAELEVASGGSLVADCSFPLQSVNHGTYTMTSPSTRIPVPAGGQIILYGIRNGGTTGGCTVIYNVIYHTVH